MKTITNFCAIAALMLLTFARCNTAMAQPAAKSYAIYTEFAHKYNKRLKDSLNRRVFNDRTVEHGTDIKLGDSGVITLQPGTYHISGFSMVTMETNMPITLHDHNYPGYCIVYKVKDENDSHLLDSCLGVGNVAASDYFTPSSFDIIYTVHKKTKICVGHQSGAHFLYPIYLTLYKTDGGEVSDKHAFARITIEKLD